MIVALVPAYNEEHNIAKLLVLLAKNCDRMYVCDDGSTDMTGSIANKLLEWPNHLISHEINSGKGSAIRDLFAYEKNIADHDKFTDIVVTIDADNQHNPNEIAMLTKPIFMGEADVVNGNRLSSMKMPLYRKIGNRILNGIHHSVTDKQCGFRAYSFKAMSLLTPTADRMLVDAQLYDLAKKANLRIKEVNVSAHYDQYSSTHNPVRHFTDIIGQKIEDILTKAPLRYVSFPGILFIIFGTAVTGKVIQLEYTQHFFSLQWAIPAFFGYVLGLTMFLTGIVLHAINRALRRT